MVAELKSCPFCGARPHQGPTKTERDQLHGEPLQRFQIWCPHGCASKTEVNKDQAITAWNRRAALKPAPKPAGGEWVTVPRVPTGAMTREGVSKALSSRFSAGYTWPDYMADLWRTMLSAAPVPPSTDGAGDVGGLVERLCNALRPFPGLSEDFEGLIGSPSAKVATPKEEKADLESIAEENADNVRILDGIANFLGVPHDEELTLQHVADRATTAEARASELQRENERLEKALRRIAEGNLGDASWEADYEKIRQVARAALQQEGE